MKPIINGVDIHDEEEEIETSAVNKKEKKNDKSKEALVRAIKNARIHKNLKNSLAKHMEIVGHYYLESEEHLIQLGEDFIKLGNKLKDSAKDII